MPNLLRIKQSELHEAIILVGGKGIRLRSAVNDRPKPMADVSGRPFVENVLLQLRSQGVSRVLFCVAHMGEKLVVYFGDGRKWNMEVHYSHEKTLLGTGGALRLALSQVLSSRILVLNGDSYCHVDINRLKEAHKVHGARATLWVVPTDDCSKFGSVEMGVDNSVLSFHEKSGRRQSGLINAGIYLFEREVIAAIPEGRPVSLETDVFPKLIGRGLYAVVGKGPFLDIGTPETYQRAKSFFGSMQCQ